MTTSLYDDLKLSKAYCDELGLIPIKREGDQITLKGSADKEKYISTIEGISGLKVILETGEDEDPPKENKDYSISPINDSITALSEELLESALENDISDIHIECLKETGRIRFRKHGRLELVREIPLHVQQQIISRIKVLAELDISQKRLPQDGRFTFHDIDVRVNTAPTMHGEKGVLRILGKSLGQFSPDHLGLDERQLALLTRMTHQSGGLLLFAGPTNSGKTTTIFSFLHQLNHPQVNIMTIEDPIEYRLTGGNQIGVNKKIGMNFTEGLRTALRQDPDILAIGEIRNEETASIALRSALTGILVFSTIHSPDAASVIFRLRDMGMENYLISEGILGVIAQRLMLKLCPHCRQPIMMNDPFFFHEPTPGFAPKGCSRCDGGYVGRKGIFEILPFDGQIRRSIYDNFSADRLHELIRGKRVSTLKTELKKGLVNGEFYIEDALKAVRSFI